jgi:hypothetical protein
LNGAGRGGRRLRDGDGEELPGGAVFEASHARDAAAALVASTCEASPSYPLVEQAKGIDCSLIAVAAAMAAAVPSGYAPPLPTTILNLTAGTHFGPFTLRLRLRPHRAAAVTAAAATLREVCAGRVPDHVLQR